MAKPKLLGQFKPFVSNSQADRRYRSKAFRHREANEQKVRQKKPEGYYLPRLAEMAEMQEDLQRAAQELAEYFGYTEKACLEIVKNLKDAGFCAGGDGDHGEDQRADRS